MKKQEVSSVDFDALNEMLAPLQLQQPANNTGGLGATFDASAERLLKPVDGSLQLETAQASLVISSGWENDNAGWGDGPPSAWYTATNRLEVSRLEEPEEYPGESLKRYIAFVSSSHLIPGRESSRERSLYIKFGLQTIVPAAPDLCAAFGVSSPSGRARKPYKVEDVSGSVEVGRKTAARRAFKVGVAILEALDEETLKKLKRH